MRLFLFLEDYRMFIVDQRSDGEFEKERMYDSTKSTTSKTLAEINEGKIIQLDDEDNTQIDDGQIEEGYIIEDNIIMKFDKLPEK